jgi:hypothetical protein
MIMVRSLPILPTRPLSGILRIRGIKLWMLNNIPSWTMVMPLLVRNRLNMGCIREKFRTKVVADNIKA